MSVVSPPHTASESRKWLVLIAVGLCVFLGSLDGSIVNVALPTLIEEFNTDFSTIQWVTLAYLIGLALLLVSMGRLADIIGKKRVFVTGIVLFLAGSALCGLAPDVYWLIGFRFLQSIGAAMMLGLGMAILTETWPSSERGKAIGLSAGFISLGIVAGPLIGGAILALPHVALDLLRQYPLRSGRLDHLYLGLAAAQAGGKT
ncbi:MAG: MFS transporter [Anaerolineales bacterium]|nr:MFS transporter [Anaerolineales bacterium]